MADRDVTSCIPLYKYCLGLRIINKQDQTRKGIVIMYRVVLTQSHQPADHSNVPTVRPKFKVVRLIDLLPLGGGVVEGSG